MQHQEDLPFNNRVVLVPTVFVAIIWAVYIIEIKFGFNFNKFGIYPRELHGLRGVFLTHFIHSDTKHLFNNSVPLFVLLACLWYFYKEVATKVLLIGAILTGFLTWCIARPSFHIGASGIVYLLFSFVLSSGIIRKHYRLVALSLVVIFLYGSMVWYVLPTKEGISWEGHLSGLITGVILAFLFKKKGIQKKDYTFSKTEFDLLFDENGNLKETIEKEDEDLELY